MHPHLTLNIMYIIGRWKTYHQLTSTYCVFSWILKASPWKTHLQSLDYIHPECSCLNMATEFGLGAAGNTETCVKLAILLWIPTLDNGNNSKDNLNVKTVEPSPPFTPQKCEAKIKPNFPTPIWNACWRIHPLQCSFSKNNAQKHSKPFPFLP